MNQAIRIFAASVILSLAAGSQSSAALVSTNDGVYGAGAITTDTATGLQWLDLTFTNGLSYNTVVAQLGSGGQFEGFRYASPSEIDAFFKHAGFAVTDNVGRAADFPTAVALFGLTGATLSYVRGDAAYGLSSQQLNFSGFDYHRVFAVYTEVPPYSNPSVGAALGLDSSSVFNTLDSEGRDFIGSWLVRGNAEVPEPASLTLFGLGAIGLAGAARRRRRFA